MKLDHWANRKQVVMYRHILNDKDEFIEEEENPVYIADVIRVMLHKNDKINIPVVNFNKTANILDLSLDQYGLFCDVIPCQKHFRSRYVNRITLCYTKILKQISVNNNINDINVWKKFFALTHVLLTPKVDNKVYSISNCIDKVLADDWTSFTVDIFIKKQINGSTNDKKKSYDTNEVLNKGWRSI